MWNLVNENKSEERWICYDWPSADRQVADCVEVGTKHIRITEHFVTKCVDPVENDANICRHNPVLHIHQKRWRCPVPAWRVAVRPTPSVPGVECKLSYRTLLKAKYCSRAATVLRTQKNHTKNTTWPWPMTLIFNRHWKRLSKYFF